MSNKIKFSIPIAVTLAFYILMRLPHICSRCRASFMLFCSDGVYIDVFFIFFVLPFVIVIYIIMWIIHYRKCRKEDMEYYKKTYVDDDSNNPPR